MVSTYTPTRWYHLLLPMLLVLFLATSASAQGFLGLPFLGGSSGANQCGPSGCDPCSPAPHLDFYVGWQGGHRQTLTASTDQTTRGALFRSIKFDTPSEGIWLGAGGAVDVSCKFGLALQGWYLFPSNKRGVYTMDPGRAVPVDLPGNLTPKAEWWYVDVMGKYRYWDQMGILVGARFDHHNFSTDSSNFGFDVGVPNPYRLDINTLTTSLFFGIEYASTNGLTLRAIYAPIGWASGLTRFGQALFNDGVNPPSQTPNEVETKKSVNPKYLAELFLEYSKSVSNNMKMGLFARGTWSHAAGRASLDETVRGAEASYDFSYDNTAWTLGGKAELLFSTSGLW